MNERRPFSTSAGSASSAYDNPKTATDVAAAAPDPSFLEQHGTALQKTLVTAASLVQTLRRRVHGLERAFDNCKPTTPENSVAAGPRPTPIALPHLRGELDSLLDEAHGLLEQLGRYIP